jgi:hypothetical protein
MVKMARIEKAKVKMAREKMEKERRNHATTLQRRTMDATKVNTARGIIEC